MPFEAKRYIDVTGVDLEKFVKECYALSHPQGYGVLHFEEGELPEDILKRILWGVEDKKDDPGPCVCLDMDYVKGRSIKMHIYKHGEKLYIPNTWYDHSRNDLQILLERVGMTDRIPPKGLPEEEFDVR